ncbi:MAG: hypothetical protein IJY04_10445, partial [Clostridia bacterium]|nr:hypothetical protein [Clostridia bacterium]
EDLREYPLNCRAKLLSLPEWSNEKTAAELIEFYNDVISDHCFIRSSLGRIEFVRERDYNGNSDDFTIVE